MYGGSDRRGSKTLRWGIALGCVIAGLVVVVAAAGDGSDSPWYVEADRALEKADPPSGDRAALSGKGDSAALSGKEPGHARSESQLSAASDPDHGSAASDPEPDGWEPVYNDEALPCTGDRQPVNFETFSAGPSLDELPLTYTERRCGGASPATSTNYLSYIYGDCEIAEGATGCQPPLEIQTWPACQRFLANYSFRGKPLPHRRLPSQDGAVVVEFNFAFDKRIEVYTGSSTVVIFATSRDLALEAAEMLRLEEKGKPPATHSDDLKSGSSGRLEPPAEGSLEGDLACQV